MTANDPADADVPVAVALRDGTQAVIRRIRPDDEPRMAEFHAGLSAQSVYQRYFYLPSLEQRVAHHRLALTCRVDGAEGLALVAQSVREDGTAEILALGRLTRTHEDGTGEIALLVADRSQRLGLGTAMMRELVAVGRRLGIRHLRGDMLADNEAMRAVVRRAGFVIRTVPGDAKVLRAELALA